MKNRAKALLIAGLFVIICLNSPNNVSQNKRVNLSVPKTMDFGLVYHNRIIDWLLDISIL